MFRGGDMAATVVVVVVVVGHLGLCLCGFLHHENGRRRLHRDRG